MENVVVERKALLEKFPGKGGWTYILLPEITPEHKDYQGQVKVSGSIDQFTFQDVSLFPYGKGRYFMTVNAAVRKAIGKEAGQTVALRISLQVGAVITQQDFLEVLADEPDAFAYYQRLPPGEQRAYLEYINAVKNLEAKIERMAEAVNTIYERHRHQRRGD